LSRAVIVLVPMPYALVTDSMSTAVAGLVLG
jgi:hypothetical protein